MSEKKELTIRPATVDDVKAISVILRELGWFGHINEESKVKTKERIARHLELCNADKSHTILVAEENDDEAIGYIAVHWSPYLILAGPEGFISELFVRESERGRGIGPKLLEEVKKQAIERGCSRLMLLNGRNQPSYKMGFYKKLGWTERKEMANYILPLPYLGD